MRKEGVGLFLVSMLFIMLVSGFVFAEEIDEELEDALDNLEDSLDNLDDSFDEFDYLNEDLNDCVFDCKNDFSNEADRSPCIRECKAEFIEDFDEELEDLYDEAEDFDEELGVDAGVTPDSFFYFLDGIIDSREEKIAEMEIMSAKCKEGDQDACEGLHTSFEKYKEYAEEDEFEVEPDEKDNERRKSRAIRGVAIREIAKNIDPGLKDEYVREIVQREKGIESAAEIASEISRLCERLSNIDPIKYYSMCNVEDGEDAPEWRKDQHRDLTDEQKKEAKKFFEIMSECFETTSDGVGGYECRCEDISVNSFSSMCSQVAPLEDKCNVAISEGGDYETEDSCRLAKEKTENMEDLLPEYLLDVLFQLEGDNNRGPDGPDGHGPDFMPKECKDAGIDFKDKNARQECSKIMVTTNAPEECKTALLELANQGEVEKDVFEKKCDEIMMDIYAPDCAENGLGPEECVYRSFDDFGPGIPEGKITSECKENDIHWAPDCKLFMESSGKYSGRGLQENLRKQKEGFGYGFSCKEIEDATERLRCYDDATSGLGGFEDEGFCIDSEEFDERVQDCVSSCPDCRWGPIKDSDCTVDIFCKMDPDFDGGWQGYDCASMYCGEGSHCEPDFGCVGDNNGPDGGQGELGVDYEESQCKDGCDQECPGASRTDCVDGGTTCACFYEDYEDDSGSGSDDSTESYSEQQLVDSSSTDKSTDNVDGGSTDDSTGTSSDDTDSSDTSSDSSTGSSSDTSSDSSDSGSSEESSSEESSDSGSNEGSSGESAGITGGVIWNDFLDYWYN